MAIDPFHQLYVYRTASQQGRIIYDCYRLMYKRELWTKAFHILYPNKKLDEHALQKIDNAISDLRNSRFRFFQNERVFVDRLALEVMDMILRNIYEPLFRYPSYETALLQIKNNWHHSVWCINGKIDDHLGKNGRKILLTLISEKISDHRFLLLLHNALSRGTLYVATVHAKFSKIFVDIFLHKFDLFMEELKMAFENEGIEHSHNISPALYEELHYIRYHSSFLIGIRSSKKRARIALAKVKNFLQENLQLKINEIGITHLSKRVSFLGYNIRKTKNEILSYDIRLEIPKKELMQFAIRHGYGNFAQFQAKPRLRLTNKNEYEIMSIYNRELKAIAAYYQFADNFHHLHKLFYLAEQSFVKTIAHKRKCSCKIVISKMKKHKHGRLTVMKKAKNGGEIYVSFVQLKHFKAKQSERSTGEPYTLKGVRTVLREGHPTLRSNSE